MCMCICLTDWRANRTSVPLRDPAVERVHILEHNMTKYNAIVSNIISYAITYYNHIIYIHMCIYIYIYTHICIHREREKGCITII